jgi:hypothetical protein
LGTAATTGLLYQPQMIGDGDCGEIGGTKIGRGNRSTRKKTCPSATLSITKTHMTRHGFEHGPPRWEANDYFFNVCGGTLGTAATTSLLYQPRMIGDGDCGEIGGTKIGRGNRSTRRKPAPSATLSFPPQIAHD